MLDRRVGYSPAVAQPEIMKVKLTSEELKAILSLHFNHEVTGFALIDPDPSPLGKLLRHSVINPLDKLYFIDNIKSLRKVLICEGKTITLMEGRWAIDNWTEFLQFVDQYNRLPISGYASGEDKGKLR
jgi:hypothetical protein